MTTHSLQAILLMGPPGSGKGTLGKMICSLTGMIHISTGDILRLTTAMEVLSNSKNDLMQSGGLLPDETIITILKNYLDGLIKTFKLSPNGIFLLDGFPRTAKQMLMLKDMLIIKKAFFLDVPKEIVKERISKRASIEQRKDDQDESVFAKRYAIYEENKEKILPLLIKDQIITLDGKKGPLEVLSNSLLTLTSTMPEMFA